MQTKVNANNGLKRLVRRCRAEFQRSENTDFYAEEDFQAAQHKFIKFCLLNEIDLDK